MRKLAVLSCIGLFLLLSMRMAPTKDLLDNAWRLSTSSKCIFSTIGAGDFSASWRCAVKSTSSDWAPSSEASSAASPLVRYSIGRMKVWSISFFSIWIPIKLPYGSKTPAPAELAGVSKLLSRKARPSAYTQRTMRPVCCVCLPAPSNDWLSNWSPPSRRALEPVRG